MIDHDRIAEVYEGTVGSREFQQVSRRRIHWMCAQVSGPDVLDVGCSQGIASILLGREGHKVVGIDREHEAIRAARERLDQEEPEVRQRVEFRVGEGRAVGFPDESFDSVLLGEVLEHQLDPGKLLAEARRVLRPDGRLVITTPYGIHPYPDHKDPLYLSALLERLAPRLSIVEIALVDRYVGIVAEQSKDRAPRVWRRALRVAEGRLADQDDTVETLRALVAELREGTRALERSLQEEDLTKKATEIQRDAAQQRERELEAKLAEAEKRTHALEAERASAAREVERLHSEVRGVRERLQGIEVGHRSAVADLERALAEKEEADTAAREARSRAGELTDLHRRLQHERTRAAALESQRDMGLRRAAEAEAQVRDAEERVRDAEERVREAGVQARDAEERAHEAENRARDAEERVRGAEERASHAEERVRDAEQQARDGEQRARDAEEQVRARDDELAEAARAAERIEKERAAVVSRMERVEAQVGASRRRLAEARTRMAELIAERDAALDSANSATRRADHAEAGLTQTREQAARDARSASDRAEALAGEVEQLRTKVDSLTTESAVLRGSFEHSQEELEREREARRRLQTRLQATTLSGVALEEQLATIRGRFGFRLGEFFRGLWRPFKRRSREPGAD